MDSSSVHFTAFLFISVILLEETGIGPDLQVGKAGLPPLFLLDNKWQKRTAPSVENASGARPTFLTRELAVEAHLILRKHNGYL